MGWISLSPRRSWVAMLDSAHDDAAGAGAVLLAASSPPVAPPAARMTSHWAEIERVRIQPLTVIPEPCLVRLFLGRGVRRLLVHEQLVMPGRRPYSDLEGQGGAVDLSGDRISGLIALTGTDGLYVSTTASVALVIVAHGRDVFECVTDDPAPSVTVINNEPSPGA